MTRMGFELSTPVFKGAKTVHALDCAATVIGSRIFMTTKKMVFDKRRTFVFRLFQSPMQLQTVMRQI
jgi:hypothetical protein